MGAYRTGVEKYRQGKLLEAKQCFEEALAKRPDDPKVNCDLGVTEIALGNIDRAIQRLKYAHDLAPQAPTILVNLANAYNRVEKPGEGLVAAKKAITLEPRRQAAWVNQAVSKLKLGRAREALEDYLYAFTLERASAEALEGAWLSAIVARDFSTAESLQARRWSLGELNADCYALAAQSAVARGDFDHGWEILRQSITSGLDTSGINRVLGQLGMFSRKGRLILEAWNREKGKGRNASDRDVILTFLCIELWRLGETETLTPLLEHLYNRTTQMRYQEADRKFICPYMRYLYLLNSETSPNLQDHLDEHLPLHVIGESHSLSLARRIFPLGRNNFVCSSYPIPGIKAWHLSAGNSAEKQSFYDTLLAIPDYEAVMFTIGEIDCRPDEGIWAFSIKNNISAIDLARKTFSAYVSVVDEVLGNQQRTVVIQGIPAPGYQLPDKFSHEERSSFLDLIDAANRVLEVESHKRGWWFIDVHYATADRLTRLSNSVWHMDQFHLNPNFYAQAGKFSRKSRGGAAKLDNGLSDISASMGGASCPQTGADRDEKTPS